MYRELGYTKSKFCHDTFQMSIHIHSYIRFGTMRNAIKISVHIKSVTSLNMIFPILPSAVNQSFTKSAYKLIHSPHALIHPYKSKAILNNCILKFEAQASKLYNIVCFTRQSVFTHTCELQPIANTSDGGVQRDWKPVCFSIHKVIWCFHIYP